jgi:hypothetical protein
MVPVPLNGFLGELLTVQGGWLKLLLREEKGDFLSPQVLSLLWDLLEERAAKVRADNLGHTVVGTGQDQPGALRTLFSLFLSFKSPSICSPCHHNLATVFKVFLKPRMRMSCQYLPYVYIGEVVMMAWCSCHYLIDPTYGLSLQKSLRRSSNLKGHPIHFTDSPKFLGCEFHTIIT